MIKDMGASIIHRLKNKSKEENSSLTTLLILFCQEEFLRRLEQTRYKEKLILKGGFLLYFENQDWCRPTQDSDYLICDMDAGKESVTNMIQEILRVNTSNDFISYEIVKISPIAEHRDYNGWRITMTARIKNTRIPCVIDLGVGDVVRPDKVKRIMETMFDDFTHPEVYTYPLELVIAEKFESIIEKLDQNGRMKDFYDIYMLIYHNSFLANNIKMALETTINTRRTVYKPIIMDEVKKLSENKDIRARWENFVLKKVTTNLDIEVVINHIVKFMAPIMEGIIKDTKVPGVWDYNLREWR